jgi:hypothetical protein
VMPSFPDSCIYTCQPLMRWTPSNPACTGLFDDDQITLWMFTGSQPVKANVRRRHERLGQTAEMVPLPV